MKYHGPTPQLKKKQGLLKPQSGPTLQVHVPCLKPFNNDASYHIYHLCYEKGHSTGHAEGWPSRQPWKEGFGGGWASMRGPPSLV